MVAGPALANPRTERVALIQTCDHGPEAVCPHARTWHVDRGAPNASDDSDGTEANPFRTIGRGASLALPGDTVLVAEGVYREYVAPAHGGYNPAHMITYAPRPGHHVVIKGSEIWRPQWRRAVLPGAESELWGATLDPALFTSDFPIEGFHPFHIAGNGGRKAETAVNYYPKCRPAEPGIIPLDETRGMIFMDGRLLREVRAPADFDRGQDVFMVAADGETILVRLAGNVSPAGRLFEVTTREQVFAPRGGGVNFVRVRGFTMEHAANGPGWPQFGMLSASGGVNWLIEDNTLRWAHSAGADIGQGAYYKLPWRRAHRVSEPTEGALDFDIIVRRCVISDNGTVGLWALTQNKRILVEDCVFERNSFRGVNTWEEGGLKCHGVRDSIFRRNLFRNNNAYALWLDVCKQNNRVTQNLFLGNQCCGVFIEGMYGSTLVDNNVAAFSQPHPYWSMTKGDGFYSHHASDVTFAHNLSFGNAGYGFRFVLHSRQRCRLFPDKIAHVDRNRVINNIAYANGHGAVGLPLDQELCTNNVSRNNLVWGLESPPMFELQRGLVAPTRMVEIVEALIRREDIASSQVPGLDLWWAGEMGPQVGNMAHAGLRVGGRVWRQYAGRGEGTVAKPLQMCRLLADGAWQININRPEKRGRVPKGETAEVIGAAPESYALLTDVECERLPEITHDYFGRPRPAGETPTVGPVQDLALLGAGQGEVSLRLWPNGPSAGCRWGEDRE